MAGGIRLEAVGFLQAGGDLGEGVGGGIDDSDDAIDPTFTGEVSRSVLNDVLQQVDSDERFQAISDYEGGAGGGSIEGEQQVPTFPAAGEFGTDSPSIKDPEGVSGQRLFGLEGGGDHRKGDLWKGFVQASGGIVEAPDIAGTKHPSQI